MIRKTALLVTGTIAGVVGVLSYNPPQLNASIAPTGNATQPQNSPSADVGTQASKSPAQPAPTTSTPKKSSTNTTSANAQTTNASASASPTPTATPTKVAGVSGTFKGDTSQTRWGPVQVEIVVTNGKITDVKTLQYPNGDRRSQNISSQVIPWLQEETLQVQSANISGISGATYTSGGFQASLASALQKAGL
ncbi:MAG: FMN-binding protein [Actinobacteria bacterium]|nr:FMN-binding protein [Actinomycetota bacterium]